jgi:hypothetical protein
MNNLINGQNELNRQFSEAQVASTHMKKRSTSLVIKEMQIKTITRLYLISVRMATVKKTNNNKSWQGWGWGTHTLI